MGRVLVDSIAEVAGEAWRPEYERASTAAFAIVAEAMMDGAAASALDLAA